MSGSDMGRDEGIKDEKDLQSVIRSRWNKNVQTTCMLMEWDKVN